MEMQKFENPVNQKSKNPEIHGNLEMQKCRNLKI